jgi:hypothetical protein
MCSQNEEIETEKINKKNSKTTRKVCCRRSTRRKEEEEIAEKSAEFAVQQQHVESIEVEKCN